MLRLNVNLKQTYFLKLVLKEARFSNPFGIPVHSGSLQQFCRRKAFAQRARERARPVIKRAEPRDVPPVLSPSLPLFDLFGEVLSINFLLVVGKHFAFLLVVVEWGNPTTELLELKKHLLPFQRQPRLSLFSPTGRCGVSAQIS